MSTREKDDENGYDSDRAAANIGDVPDDVTGENEDLQKDDLLPPGSTADGAGTALGEIPDEAEEDAEPLGTGTGTAGDSAGREQLADERFRNTSME